MNLANGMYRARATSGVLGETSTGKEQMVVDFELLDAGFEGQHLTWFGFFTEKTLESTIKGLRACGWTGDDLMDLAGIDTNEVSLVVENETYEGKTRARVRWVNPINTGLSVKAPLPEDKAKAFAAKMRGQIRAMEKAPPKKGPPPRRPSVGDTDPDELPF